MIRQLDKHLINKIAAGEVVERPLSVVKELTENAIDAGAGSITVEIKNGGLSLIRVTDNGSGISDDQVLLAFAQHATSKISDIEDLYSIVTLGFRGEALASIASVSQVEMVTKTAGALSGTRIELHGGVLVARQELGCSEGTTVNVSNIFFNTPARLKFLKKPPTEAGYITDLIQRLALGYPALAFRYINNGQSVITTSGNGDLKAAIYQIYGKDAAKKLLTIRDGFISGYAGKPEIARGSRSASNFFMNGRYIRSKLLQSAVEDAYQGRLTIGRFPLCVLHLKVPPGQVDVNVHPAKMEVRFANEQEVYTKVKEALSKALTSCDLIPEIRPSVENSTNSTNSMDSMSSISDNDPSISLAEQSKYEYATITSGAVLTKDTALTKETTLTKETALTNPHNFILIGQIFNTYWLAVQEDQLFLIDQHAAHERILYEEMLHRLKNQETPSQPLLEPLLLNLSPKELAIAQEHKQALEDFGFRFGGFQTNTLLAVPTIIKGQIEAFFTEILDKLEKGSEETPTSQIREQLAMAACKGAVKANDSLAITEARGLINKLLALENPYFCPHGRPTMVKLTRREIEQMFKRT